MLTCPYSLTVSRPTIPRSRSPDTNFLTMSFGLWNQTSKLESCNIRKFINDHSTALVQISHITKVFCPAYVVKRIILIILQFSFVKYFILRRGRLTWGISATYCLGLTCFTANWQSFTQNIKNKRVRFCVHKRFMILRKKWSEAKGATWNVYLYLFFLIDRIIINYKVRWKNADFKNKWNIQDLHK